MPQKSQYTAILPIFLIYKTCNYRILMAARMTRRAEYNLKCKLSLCTTFIIFVLWTNKENFSFKIISENSIGSNL